MREQRRAEYITPRPDKADSGIPGTRASDRALGGKESTRGKWLRTLLVVFLLFLVFVVFAFLMTEAWQLMMAKYMVGIPLFSCRFARLRFYRPPRTRTGARPAARGGGYQGSKKYRQGYNTKRHMAHNGQPPVSQVLLKICTVCGYMNHNANKHTQTDLYRLRLYES